MLNKLTQDSRAVGAKQARRTLNDGRANRLFVASDADPRITDPLRQLAAEKNVPVEEVPTMKELGSACGIAVGSAVAVLLN